MKWVRFGSSDWLLYVDGKHVGDIQRFYREGPYYGTWEINGGGRTGPMSDLAECKRRVENKVRPG